MDHKAEVIEVSEVGDGLLAVRVRCCGDALSDSVVTIHDLHRTNEEIDKDVMEHCARVEKLHEAKRRAKEHLLRLKR